MKTIGLVTVNEEIGLFLKKQLEDLLGSIVHINLYILSQIEEKQVLHEEAMMIFTGRDSLKLAEQKLAYDCEGLIANRSISYSMLGGIFDIPKGTEVYLYNDFEDSAVRTVEYLDEMGISHIKCRPLYPGADMDEAIEHIISIGAFDHFSAEHKKIIELGCRTIDISTIVEILIRLDISREKIGFFAAKYIKDIIELTNRINQISMHNEFILNQMQAIIDTMNDGLVVINEEEEISVFNTVAENMLCCSCGQLIGRKLSDLKNADRRLYDALCQIVEGKDEILTLFQKKIVVTRSEFIHDSQKEEKLYVLKEVTEIQELEKQLRMKISQNKYQARYDLDDILGESEIMLKQKAMVERVASFDSPVYIYGESGTGKELFANAIHMQSRRKDSPFVAVNFAAMSESLIESELFGYAEGAFTGAKKGGRPGLFEQAHGGTLFLDEIGDAPLHFQVKLLRVLQEKTVRRIGDDKVIPIDVRIIAATNKDIAELVRQGQFREDLFYRINVLSLRIPPLRERKDDIELFARHFYREFTVDDPKRSDFASFFKEVRNEIVDYSFPGNVRQLRNLIEYLFCTADTVAVKENLPPDIFGCSGCESDTGGRSEKFLQPADLLRIIYHREAKGLTSGRRSLAAETGLSENRIQEITAGLQEKNYIKIFRGRGGIRITDKGREKMESSLKESCR